MTTSEARIIPMRMARQRPPLRLACRGVLRAGLAGPAAALLGAASRQGLTAGRASAAGSAIAGPGNDAATLNRDRFTLSEGMRALGLPVEMRLVGGDQDWAIWSRALPEAFVFLDCIFRAPT